MRGRGAHSRSVTWGLALVLGFLVWVQAVPAFAHAYIVRSNPTQGAVLTKSPHQVEIWFDESVQAVFDAVKVVNASGQRVDAHNAHINPHNLHELVCTLTPNLPSGFYSVEWRVVSADGHPVNGVLTFQVTEAGGQASGRGSADEGAQAPESARGAQAPSSVTQGYLPGVDMVVIRTLTYLGVVVALGSTFLVVGVLAGIPGAYMAKRRVRQLRLLASISLVLGILLSLPLQTRIDADIGWGQAFSLSLWGTMLKETRFGQVWPWQFGVGLLLLALSAFVLPASERLAQLTRLRTDRQRLDEDANNMGEDTGGAVSEDTYVLTRVYVGLLETFASTAGIAILLCQSLIGHAGAETEPAWPVMGDVAHMLAASIWLGGVVSLAMLAFFPDKDVWLTALRRFGPWAGASLVVVVGTGVYASLLHIPTWYALGHTRYGRTLLLKLVLVALMMGLGVLHFWLVRRGGRTDAQARQRPKRSLWLEAIVGVCVLGLTAVLTNLPTAMAAPGPVNQTLALTKGAEAQIEIQPNVIGRNQVVVRLYKAGEPETDVQQVTVTFTMLDMSMPSETVRLRQTAPGVYTAIGNWLSMAGHWRVRVHVLTSAFADENGDLRMVVGTLVGG
ncbi:copper resistance protein CopC [Alicyclobacillus herbarius]|uniref:copper resistance protein CopC n=1 Tax=Alicyclobacillus herbarius TaxID=122960 RepID=UPI0004265A7C|nr:copper resistance protein CopC [Alicyclobacillus herbarius]